MFLLNYYNETEKYSNDWHTFRFYIENKSEKKLNIDSENQVLNGVSYDDEVMFIHDILSDGRKYFMTYYIREDDVGDIEKLCDRVIIIDQGKIVIDENIKTLKEKYMNEL